MTCTCGTETSNVRISINDLVRCARVVHDFRVVAAGAMYATIALSDKQIHAIHREGINWVYD